MSLHGSPPSTATHSDNVQDDLTRATSLRTLPPNKRVRQRQKDTHTHTPCLLLSGARVPSSPGLCPDGTLSLAISVQGRAVCLKKQKDLNQALPPRSAIALPRSLGSHHSL